MGGMRKALVPMDEVCVFGAMQFDYAACYLSRFNVLFPVWRAPFSKTTGVSARASLMQGQDMSDVHCAIIAMKIVHSMDDLRPDSKPPAMKQTREYSQSAWLIV